MSYVVLARKWRPMSFADLVGQDHVARTLGNAIKAGRVAHAFLFTGVRGVGKTTSARILAKALNCMGDPDAPSDADRGPTVEPCLKCPACLEIAQGRDVDVQEIDGASYNGVDEVRKLQDSLPYRPTRDRYKIVIVDEVHMLTNNAWNAFLKTLEEPPPHVKFIFATTEVHKLPITILSRVQRFDFKMIPVKTIAARLRYVLSEEKIEADETAIALIARQAAGSMRDGMSLLDQVIAFGGSTLKGDEVALALGAASRGRLTELAEALVLGKPDRCLKLTTELSDQGFDIQNLAKDLLGLLRDLVVAKVVKNPAELLDVSDEELALVEKLAASAQESDLLRLHQGFSKGFDEVARGADPRAALEMLLVRLSLRPQLLPVDELLHRIGHLEKRLFEGGSSGRSPGSGFSPGNSNQRSAPQPSAPRDVAPRDGKSSPREARSPSATRRESGEDPSDEGPPLREAPKVAPPEPQKVVLPPEPEPQRSSSLPEIRAVSTFVLSPERARALARSLPVFDRLREENTELSGYFEQLVPLRADEELLELAFESGYLFEKQVDSPEAQELVLRLAREVLGSGVTLRLEKGSAKAHPEESISSERARRKRARHEEAVLAVKNHPKIIAALRIFGAEVKSVFVPES